MPNQISFNNAVKEVTGDNFVTLDQLKNDNEIYFPLFKDNANGTEAKKILGNLIANNGGGTSDYVMPKNVIVINPDAEEVVGKVYHTFAAAKSYMETYPEQKFCVELPAGEFSEPITLDEKWLIHGNNTIITTPINSNVVLGENFVVNPSGVFILDCTVSDGFVGYYGESDSEFSNIPVYKLNHCRITEFCSSSETEDLFFCLCDHCEIETTRSHNNLIAKGTPMSVPNWVMTFHSTILQFGASVKTKIFCLYTGIRNVGADSAEFQCCETAFKAAEELHEINVSILSMANCYFQTLESNNNDMSIIKVCNSNVTIAMEGEINIHRFSANNSELWLRTKNGATITVGESWVSPDTVCRADTRVTWSATNDHTLCYVMYSTDGGQTMSYNSIGATHYGILKHLPDPEEGLYMTDYYMWFPMP